MKNDSLFGFVGHCIHYLRRGGLLQSSSHLMPLELRFWSYSPSRLVFCSVRNSMSYLRQGRGAESRRSVFYIGNNSTEEWELVDAPHKDFAEQKHHPNAHRRTSTSCDLNYPDLTGVLILILILHSPLSCIASPICSIL